MWKKGHIQEFATNFGLDIKPCISGDQTLIVSASRDKSRCNFYRMPEFAICTLVILHQCTYYM